MPSNLLRNLPSVNELLESPQLKGLADRVSRNQIVSKVRSFLDDLRVEVAAAASDMRLPAASEITERIARRILEGRSREEEVTTPRDGARDGGALRSVSTRQGAAAGRSERGDGR